MGRRGPPPKPTAQKKLEGTFRPDRAAHNEVIAPPGSPRRPADLTPAAAAKWDEIMPLLLARATLSEEDGAVLEAHCRAYAMWKRYQSLAEVAPVLRDKQFGIRINPAAAEARQWETRMTITGDRLGLSASSRSRVSAAEKPPSKEDETEAFLFNGPRLVTGGK